MKENNDPLSLSSQLYEPKRYAPEESYTVECTCKARTWTLTGWQIDSSTNHGETCPVFLDAIQRLSLGKGGSRDSD